MPTVSASVRSRAHDDPGRRTVSGLASHLDGWRPEPLRRSDQIRRWPVDAFAGLLDQPVVAVADPLPPMWHWFSFLEHPGQAELGTDGHPSDGHFLPPIPHRRRMFAGGRWRCLRPLRIGAEASCEASVISVEPKTGRSGEMAFVTIRSEYSQGGRLAVVEEQDIVYRSAPPATAEPTSTAAAAPPPEAAQDSAPAEFELTVNPDPPLLFRYSALTYNTHRIHYDQSYATGVEGYPGLVVHGPLLAMLALELPRRNRAGDAVLEFRYRLRRPAFAGAAIVARSWTPNQDGWCELAVGEPGRLPALTANARLGELS